METIKVELTNEEAELFKKFRKYQDFWEDLSSLISGEVTISMANNSIQWWEVKNRSYPQKDQIA